MIAWVGGLGLNAFDFQTNYYNLVSESSVYAGLDRR
jgi:hypothetical protein